MRQQRPFVSPVYLAGGLSCVAGPQVLPSSLDLRIITRQSMLSLFVWQ
jgi:hypothetical protein